MNLEVRLSRWPFSLKQKTGSFLVLALNFVAFWAFWPKTKRLGRWNQWVCHILKVGDTMKKLFVLHLIFFWIFLIIIIQRWPMTVLWIESKSITKTKACGNHCDPPFCSFSYYCLFPQCNSHRWLGILDYSSYAQDWLKCDLVHRRASRLQESCIKL